MNSKLLYLSIFLAAGATIVTSIFSDDGFRAGIFTINRYEIFLLFIYAIIVFPIYRFAASENEPDKDISLDPIKLSRFEIPPRALIFIVTVLVLFCVLMTA